MRLSRNLSTSKPSSRSRDSAHDTMSDKNVRHDSSRDRAVAQEKPRRGSRDGGATGGSSKKSTRRKTSSSSSRATVPGSAGAGGERAQGYGSIDPRGENGGLAARPDLADAEGKGPARPIEAELTSRTRPGAKGVRRGGGRADPSGGEGRAGQGGVRREIFQREQRITEKGVVDIAGNSVDRAILQKWRSDATAADEDGRNLVSSNVRAAPQGLPEMEVEDEDNGGGYDDECFEEYSDEFDGEGEDESPTLPAAKTTVLAATAAFIRPGSARSGGSGGSGSGGGAGEGGAVVSPALRMRKAGDNVQAPDDKALEELRDSLREENIVARERKEARPSTNVPDTARAEVKSSSDAAQAARGSKGARGSRNSSAGATAGGTSGYAAAVARGKFSAEASADVKQARRDSGFKMADAKALTRALAKGDPRTERVLAIRAASRLEVESVRLFDQPPVLPIDLYHRRLRGQPALIRQVGSQTNEDARSIEAQTDEIVRTNKEVQFHLGHDDTALENLMRRLRSNRRRPKRPKEEEEEEEEEAKGQQRTLAEGGQITAAAGPGSTTTTFKGLYNGSGREDGERGVCPVPGYGSDFDCDLSTATKGSAGPDPLPSPLRLGKFLLRASVVMETLCEENLLHASARGRGVCDLLHPGRGGDQDSIDREGGSLFSRAGSREGEEWEEVGVEAGVFRSGGGGARTEVTEESGRLRAEEKRTMSDDVGSGRDGTRGLGRLLEGSEVVGVEFSRVKRTMLVTAHARSVGQRSRPNHSGGGGGGDGGSGAVVGERKEAVLEGCGVLCVWNAENVEAAPVSVLCGEGLFSCFCLALHQAHVVVAGTAEGCLLLWDLREPASSSHAEESENIGLHCGIRAPTYTTAGGGGGAGGGELSKSGYGHASTIVSVVPIPLAEGGGHMDGGGEEGIRGGVPAGKLSLGEACSWQVASLDDMGTVSIWLASEASRGDEGGSQTDLGLSPGGRVRLTLSKSFRPGVRRSLVAMMCAGGGGGGGDSGKVSVSAPRFSAAIGRREDISTATDTTVAASASTQALAFSPKDPNRFLIGGSSGRVIHASRLGDPPPPRTYYPPRRPQECRLAGGGEERGQDQRAEMEGGVTCLAFSPFFAEYFLAGCGDGSLRLYKDDSGVPLTAWEGVSPAAGGTNTRSSSNGWPTAISSVAWSEHRPAVFFALDASGTLHAFDLLEDDAGPVASERCPHTATSVKEPSAPGWSEMSSAARVSSPILLQALALSSETLATGSRPKVALAFGGRVFTKALAGRMFRQSEPPPGAGRVEGQEGGGIESGAVSERERMKEWLGEVLWA